MESERVEEGTTGRKRMMMNGEKEVESDNVEEKSLKNYKKVSQGRAQW